MKFLRFLAQLFVVLLVLAGVLAAIAFIPAVQTWLLGRNLEKHPELRLSVASIWARFGRADAEGVRLELPGAVLTVPTIESEVPITTGLRTGRLSFHRLVAKGWTLDFRDLPKDVPPADENASPTDDAADAKPAPADAAPAPAQAVVSRFKGILSWKLPFDFSADEVDLEGDVLLPAAAGADPDRIHVIIQGTGVGPHGKGELKMKAEGTSPSSRFPDFSAEGALAVSMYTPRTFNRLDWNPLVTIKSDSSAEVSTIATGLSVSRDGAEETYTVSLKQAEHELATVSARFKPGTDRLPGAWKLDLGESDLLPFLAGSAVPALPVSGVGTFDCDTSFASVHVSGDLRADPKHSGALTSALGLVGIGAATTHFDLVRSGDIARVNQFSATISGIHPLVTLAAVQPFDFDLKKKIVTPTSPASDCFEGMVTGIPLSWIEKAIRPWVVSGGDVTGEFSVRLADGGFVVRGKKPIDVAHASLQRDGALFVRDIDLSISLLAELNSKGWKIEGAPLKASQAGKSLGELDVAVSRPHDSKYPLTLATKGRLDLEALSLQPGFSGINDLSLAEISGDVVTTIGQWIHFAGAVTLAQRESTQSVSAKLNADVRNDHSIVFRVPLTLSNGTASTELATQGSWLPSKYGHEINASIAGKDLTLENLRIFGPLLTRILRPSSPGAEKTTEVRDTTPFWGDAVGRVTSSFEHLRIGGSDLQDVHANLRLEHNKIQLEQGRYQLSNHLAEADVAVTFDPKADVCYQVTGKFDDGEIDAEPLFGPPPEGQDPPFHGKFAVASTLKGSGNTLSELVRGTQQEFRLKSTSGIVRFLKTHVTGLTHEKESKLGDAADVVGTLFGKVAGVKPNSIVKQQIKLSKPTEAVLNFSYDCAEIGYSELTITAARGLDGVLHINDLSMIAPDEHLTGTGELTDAGGTPLIKDPLHAEFRFAVRDKTAELLAGTGLLSAEKDALGYTLFKKSFRVSGTLQHLDITEWHDLLYDAALANTDPKKK